jgi:Uma2 family endonuclease
MSAVDMVSASITAETLMEMPDDGVEREIIRGELREQAMSRRSPEHSSTEARIAQALSNWSDAQVEPRGKVFAGDAAFRLEKDPETFVGIDVAYVSPEMVARHDSKLKFYDEPPVLAVEILSPSDQQEDIADMVQLYLEFGIVAWLANPRFRTVSVHRRGRAVETYNNDQELPGGPELSGFRVAVSRLFDL